ncbi:MAG: IPTL-CTERM sorting domain-containing protein [Candidatus Zixiibacteriota bacterium]|nr:MAG: IPTL-CTERM sorting domain-containing protein [candidate division Zixibacteria bacterium]
MYYITPPLQGRNIGSGLVRNVINIILIFTLLSGIVYAETGQVYFKFRTPSREQLRDLSRLISIDNVRPDTVFAYATDDQFDYFKTLGYEYIILPNPGSLIIPRMADTRDEILQWDSYPTYEAYVAMMYQFGIDYPGLCIIQNIGYSVDGREILFAKISANVNIEEDEPEVMYSSTMHGDETTGYILMLRLIDSLLVSYGSNPQLTYMLDNMEVWINPLANPDGTYAGGNHTVNGAIRYNSNGADLNRNFPDPEDGPHPDGREWQPETIAMMNFFNQHTFIISANFHGGIEVVNYPWDTWPRRHADDSWFIEISREYADSAQANSPSGYMDDLNNGITNGWDWYEVNGGRQDYLTYWKGCRETTIEISQTKLLPPSLLPDHWDYNKAALITYLEQAYYGIRGLVTDAISGYPVSAIISVMNHDIDSSEVYTDPDVGDYHRMIDNGTYDLIFSAPGYISQVVNDIVVIDRQVNIINVQLNPVPLTISLPDGPPEYLPPGIQNTFTVQITDGAEIYVPGTGTLHYRYYGGGFSTSALTHIAGDLYEAVLPPADCDAMPEFYVSAHGDGGSTVYDPPDAPGNAYSSTVGILVTIFEDDFETDQGWTVSGDALDGHWERGVPVGGGDRGDPPNDYDGSGQCYLTDNVDGNSDVDGGYTYLTSPAINLNDSAAQINYALWYTNNAGDNPNSDLFITYVSSNNGTNWVPAETIGPVTSSGWTEHTINIAEHITPSNQVKIRFEASDLGGGSVVEAGIDAVSATILECQEVSIGTIAGTVTDTGGAVSGVQVNADDSLGHTGSDITQGDGTYSINVPAGVYDLSFSHPAHRDTVIYDVAVTEGDTVIVDVVLEQIEIQIPTLNEWGMLIMSLSLLAVGTAAILRRKGRLFRKPA